MEIDSHILGLSMEFEKQNIIITEWETEKAKSRSDNIYERNLDQVKVRSGSICGLSQIGDSCKGDSGSGLVYRNPRTQNYEIVGIVSYGAGCNSTFNSETDPLYSYLE